MSRKINILPRGNIEDAFLRIPQIQSVPGPKENEHSEGLTGFDWV